MELFIHIATAHDCYSYSWCICDLRLAIAEIIAQLAVVAHKHSHRGGTFANSPEIAIVEGSGESQPKTRRTSNSWQKSRISNQNIWKKTWSSAVSVLFFLAVNILCKMINEHAAERRWWQGHRTRHPHTQKTDHRVPADMVQ